MLIIGGIFQIEYGRRVWELSATTVQFFYKPKTAKKN